MSETARGAPRPAPDDGAPPLIGITTYQEPARWGVWVREAALLPVPYARSVERAGGIPVLLPPASTLRGVETLVSRLDGVVLAAAETSTPTCTAPPGTSRPGRRSRSATGSSWRSPAPSSRPTCRSWRSAGACRC